MHAYIKTYKYIQAYIKIHTDAHIHLYIYAHICNYVNTHNMYIYTNTYIHKYICMCIYVQLCRKHIHTYTDIHTLLQVKTIKQRIFRIAQLLSVLLPVSQVSILTGFWVQDILCLLLFHLQHFFVGRQIDLSLCRTALYRCLWEFQGGTSVHLWVTCPLQQVSCFGKGSSHSRIM